MPAHLLIRALTGPCAAQLLQLDGFREGVWPVMWCAPNRSRQHGVVRCRGWDEPSTVNDVPVALPSIVLRHLAAQPLLHTKLSDHDLVELALEHCLRTQDRGARILREVVSRRPPGEPATESYAETRGIQVFRSVGLNPWRQMAIFDGVRLKHRVDFVIPAGQRKKRPQLLTPADGTLVEIDSREWHEGRFEEDHERQSVYDRLGYNWISLTPNQLESRQVQRTIEGAVSRLEARR
jgi:hypothetical protein